MAESTVQTQGDEQGGTDARPGDRVRTHSWSDPAPAMARLAVTDGLDLLNAMGSGELALPPFASTVGITAVEAEAGRVVFSFTPGEHHLNPLGVVHGGMIATLLDTCTGCAVHTTLRAGQGYTSIDVSVRFLRPVTLDSGEIRGEGIVLSSGRRTALAEAKAYDSSGRLVAHATSTCLLLDVSG